jgi:signal transduction histidine kinase/CheY-like chemotaxis protein
MDLLGTTGEHGDEVDVSALLQQEARRLLPTAIALLFVGSAITAVTSWVSADYKAFSAAAACAALLPLLYLAARRGHHRLAGAATVVTLLGAALYVVLLGRGIYDLGMMIFPVILLVSALLLDRGLAVAISALCVTSVVGVGTAQVLGALRGPRFGRPGVEDVVDVAILLLAAAAIVRLLTAALERGLQRAMRVERTYQARLREGEKLRALGQLAGGIAHDFNNQLNAILGSAALLERHIEGRPQARQHLDLLVGCAQRSADLTRQLLAFARKGNQHHVPVNCERLVDEVIELLSHSLDKRIRIQVSRPGAAAVVHGDPSLLQSGVLNLGLNAGDAMPEGGVLTFELGHEHVGGPGQRSARLPAGRYVVLRVRDTGAGMSAATRARLFEPFFTTKPDGVGMGLAALFGTVQAHGGTITVESEPGRGTTFEILLPAVDVAQVEGALAVPVDAGADISLQGTRVLLADDEAVVLLATKRLLEHLGCKVTACRNGREAVEAVRTAAQDFDVLLMDHGMPGLSGAEALREIRALGSRLPVLIASGYAVDAHPGGFDDAQGFLPKPFMARDLTAALAAVLRKPEARLRSADPA